MNLTFLKGKSYQQKNIHKVLKQIGLGPTFPVFPCKAMGNESTQHLGQSSRYQKHGKHRAALNLAWQNIQYSNAQWEGIQTVKLIHPQVVADGKLHSVSKSNTAGNKDQWGLACTSTSSQQLWCCSTAVEEICPQTQGEPARIRCQIKAQ